MDLSCIISSGDLELYVLGMLPEEEAYKISQLALLFDEVAAEINRIQESLQVVSEQPQLAPRPQVRENFIQAIKELKAAEQPTSLNTEQMGAKDEEEPARVVQFQPKQKSSNYLLAASLIGLAICLGAIVFLFNRNEAYKNQVAYYQQNADSSIQVYKQQVTGLEHLVAMMQDPATQKIQLKNMSDKQANAAQVFWNKRSHDVMLSSVSLPAPPSGKQYQLWAIVNGKPVDAGLLSKSGNDMQKMKPFDNVDAFAITMENEGGSPTPTLSALMAMAKVS